MTDSPPEISGPQRRLARERAARIEAETIAERVLTEQYEVVRDLMASRAVLDETPDFVAILNPEGEATYLNRALRELVDLNGDNSTAFTVTSLLTPHSRERFADEAIPAINAHGVWRGELALVRPRGGEIPVSQVLIGHRVDGGKIERISFIARDMTEHHDLSALLTHRATHDQLTSLPNRRLAYDRLDLAVARSVRNETSLAVLFLDLDGFKAVNDSLGHAIGDLVLLTVAGRLAACMRQTDTLARVGGDEFIVVCEALTDDDAARDVADRLIEAVRQPVNIGNGTASVGLSIGIAISHGASVSPDALVHSADGAMYEAKQAGRGGHRLVVLEPPAHPSQRYGRPGAEYPSA